MMMMMTSKMMRMMIVMMMMVMMMMMMMAVIVVQLLITLPVTNVLLKTIKQRIQSRPLAQGSPTVVSLCCLQSQIDVSYIARGPIWLHI